MTEWPTLVRDHAAHKSLRNLATRLTSAEAEAAERPEDLIQIKRLQQVVEHVQAVLSAADPNLIPKSVLDNVHQSGDAADGELQHYLQNNNAAHLGNAQGQADNMLVHSQRVPSVQTPQDAQGVGAAISSLRRSIGQYGSNVEQERKTLKESLSKLREEFNGLQTRIREQTDRLDQALTEQQDRIDKAEKARWTRLEETLTGVEERFSNAQTDRKERYEEMVEEQRKQLAADTANIRDAATQHLDTTKSESSEILNQLQGLRQKAEDLVHVVGNTGLVGGYKEVADAAGKEAHRWQLLTALGLVGFIGFAVWAATMGATDDWNWVRAVTKISAGAAFAAFAGFAGTQVHRAHETERKNRDLQLQLAAIAPYLADLPHELQHDIKRDIAREHFAPRATSRDGDGLAPVRAVLQSEKDSEETDAGSRLR